MGSIGLTVSKIRNYIHEATVCPKKKSLLERRLLYLKFKIYSTINFLTTFKLESVVTSSKYIPFETEDKSNVWVDKAVFGF
jgi:hypothetical protein